MPKFRNDEAIGNNWPPQSQSSLYSHPHGEWLGVRGKKVRDYIGPYLEQSQSPKSIEEEYTAYGRGSSLFFPFERSKCTIIYCRVHRGD